MDGADFGVGLGRQEGEDVDSLHARLDLPDAGVTLKVDASEKRQRLRIVNGQLEPDRSILALSVSAGLAERRERNQASLRRRQPRFPVR